MDAKLRPYDMANVVDRKSGEYPSYRIRFSVVSSLRICDTSYGLPVLSYDVRDDIGIYLADHVLV